MFADIAMVLVEFAVKFDDDTRYLFRQPRNPGDRLQRQMKTVELVEHRHVKGHRGRAFLDEAAYVEILVIGAPIGQPCG